MSTPDWHGYADELDGIESDLSKLNDQKRDIFKNVRDIHGAVTANALKTALRIRRMTADKREQAEQVEAVVAGILEALARPAPSRAVRHARTRGRPAPVVDEAFDPETGEIEDRSGVPAVVTAPAESAADEISAQLADRSGAETAVHPGAVLPATPSNVQPLAPHLAINPKTGVPIGPDMPAWMRRTA